MIFCPLDTTSALSAQRWHTYNPASFADLRGPVARARGRFIFSERRRAVDAITVRPPTNRFLSETFPASPSAQARLALSSGQPAIPARLDPECGLAAPQQSQEIITCTD